MLSDTACMNFVRNVPEEQVYFMKWARRFDDHPFKQRYGILIMNSKPCDENMIWAECPRVLHKMHIEHLINHRELIINTASGLRRFLNWLEGVEGKGPAVSMELT